VVKLLKDAKIKLPSWAKEPNLKKTRTTRNPDKLRKNRPAEEAPAEKIAEPVTKEVPAIEAPVEEPTEAPAE
jgi:hypothetical protein